MNPPDFEAAKQHMLRKQLRRRGIVNSRVLGAMARVPRERFVDLSSRDQAYSDQALTIGCGQTISQPYIVGLMSQSLELVGVEKVLEVGTGSGYQTAILAELCSEVVSIERYPALSSQAGRVLAELGYANVTLVVGDGSLGWPDRAPYDRIVVTAAALACPAALWQQLREGGIIVIPIGGAQSQTLRAIRKDGGLPSPTDLSFCRFVPLVGAQGWPE
jgi:protein-L-isoaspartate(D-aspartate) O-methyltransferase